MRRSRRVLAAVAAGVTGAAVIAAVAVALNSGSSGSGSHANGASGRQQAAAGSSTGRLRGVPSVSGHPKPYEFDNSMTGGNLGPEINDRSQDPAPVTMNEVFGQTSQVARPTFGGTTLTLLGKDLRRNCAAGVWGSALRRDLAAAGCTQAIRGMYVNQNGRYIGMFAVFNLRSAANASRVAFAMGPARVKKNLLVKFHHGHDGFILSLAVKPAEKPGDNRDNESLAKAFGHFLIIEWSQGPGGRQEDDFNLDPVVNSMDNMLISGFLDAREQKAFDAHMNR